MVVGQELPASQSLVIPDAFPLSLFDLQVSDYHLLRRRERNRADDASWQPVLYHVHAGWTYSTTLLTLNNPAPSQANDNRNHVRVGGSSIVLTSASLHACRRGPPFLVRGQFSPRQSRALHGDL